MQAVLGRPPLELTVDLQKSDVVKIKVKYGYGAIVVIYGYIFPE